MIKKVLLKYSLILFVNLAIFLSIWYALDYYFKTNWKIIIWSLILSIVSLVILTQNLITKNLKQLNNIKNENRTNKS